MGQAQGWKGAAVRSLRRGMRAVHGMRLAIRTAPPFAGLIHQKGDNIDFELVAQRFVSHL